MSDRVANSTGRLIGPRTTRAFLLLASICIGSMPSIYRGGAEVAHAHGFFQFWLSGANSAFDHHHAEQASHDHDHQDESPLANRVTDEPSVSPAVEPGGGIDAMPLLAGALLLMALPLIARWRSPGHGFRGPGVAFRPEPPPPRLVAVI